MSDHTHRTQTKDRGIYCKDCCQFLRLDPVSLKWEPIDEAPIVRSNWDPNVKPFTAMLGSARKHTFGDAPPEKKARKHKEAGLQERVIKWARDRGEPVFRVEEARKLTPQAALRAKRLGAWAGVPDLIFPRIPLGCELKDTDGETSTAQLEAHSILRECGWVIVIGWGYENTITQLEVAIERHKSRSL
jgi:hypothetical protein